MIDELITEINELKEYKEKYEYALADKQRMSNLLDELMSEKYDNLSYDERLKWHEKEICSHCRYCGCGRKLADDIGCFLPSEKAYIPSRICCKNFDWS